MLASWQKAGIKIINENKSPNRLKLAMSEFNSASCGGIPGISDTFVVGSMWTADYALQMASVGYSAAYLHTRERGISYNLVAPPDGPDGNAGPWTTGPPYYALILVAEALKSNNGSIVIDLDVRNSTSDKAATVGGYAVHDANDRSIQQLVLFNYGNTSSAAMEFAIPTTAFPSDSKQSNVTVKYLTAASEHERTNISWGGETLADVGNGKLRQTSDTWAKANDVLDCAKGCSVTVPAPGIAVVFIAGVPNITTVPNSTTTSGIPKAGNSSKRSVGSPFIFLIISIILLAYI
ncbi:hypothetical protein BD779DRAFT_397048 [Infundibulicybe gibba]|nr:hypothetical protein BD779DRAFT_397048 [Infundibulicybe gibba]